MFKSKFIRGHNLSFFGIGPFHSIGLKLATINVAYEHVYVRGTCLQRPLRNLYFSFMISMNLPKADPSEVAKLMVTGAARLPPMTPILNSTVPSISFTA